MIHRVLFYGLFLVAAGVLPYLSSEWSSASRSAPTSDSSAAGKTSDASSLAVAPAAPGAVYATATTAPPSARPQRGELPVIDLSEAIRFDITTSSLFQRWPRVVTGLPEGELQGYRMPLITGTREDDIAGSLTYYFNRQQVCQKITLQGSVGDPRKLTAHVVGRFGLLRQTSADAGLHLYQTRWNGKPVSELKIKAVPVVKASATHARYDVEMVLNSWPRK
jgi:hypothetical protein